MPAGYIVELNNYYAYNTSLPYNSDPSPTPATPLRPARETLRLVDL